MSFLRVVTETAEERQARQARQKRSLQDRDSKLERTRRGGAGDDVEYANAFRLLGIDYLSIPREQAFRIVPERLEGRRVAQFEPKALDFLHENFEVEHVQDEEGRKLLHFKPPSADKEPFMKIVDKVAEESGEKKKRVKAFYEAFCKTIRHELRDTHFVQLPGLGRITLQYRAARPERPGINPFNKKKMMFKAKPAFYALKYSPAKELKDYIAEKAELVTPEKKEKKEKKKHHHH